MLGKISMIFFLSIQSVHFIKYVWFYKLSEIVNENESAAKC